LITAAAAAAVYTGSSKLLELPLTQDGKPYHSTGTAAAAAAVVREVLAKQRSKRKRRPRLTLAKR
jgi:hypothetical protein